MKRIQKIRSAVTISLFSAFFIFSLGTQEVCSYEETEVRIPVSCAEFGEEHSHVYEIHIDSETENSPAPVFGSLNIEEGSIGYLEVNITEPGEFVYSVYQKKGKDRTIDYDTSVYHVTVFAEIEQDGILNYALVAELAGRDEKPPLILFKNDTLPDKNTRTTEKFNETETLPTDVPLNSEPGIPEASELPSEFPSESTTEPEESTEEVTEPAPETEESFEETFPESETELESETITESTTSKPRVPDVDTPKYTPTIPPKTVSNTVTEFIGSVLTGDKFPIRAVTAVMISAVLIAVSALPSKRKHSEEEDKNDS